MKLTTLLHLVPPLLQYVFMEFYLEISDAFHVLLLSFMSEMESCTDRCHLPIDL